MLSIFPSLPPSRPPPHSSSSSSCHISSSSFPLRLPSFESSPSSSASSPTPRIPPPLTSSPLKTASPIASPSDFASLPLPPSTSGSRCPTVSPSFSSSRSSAALAGSEMATPEPSCSASHCQAAQQDVLSEYLKGLQEANKALDADMAERVLQELAESLTSPAAAALVVSSGGARLIASSVKQFRSHGLQKISKSSGKVSSLGSRASSISKISEADRKPLAENSPADAIHSADSSVNHENAEKVTTQHGQSSPAAALNETRRKRQRTSGELDEDDDNKNECTGDIEKEFYSPSLSVVDNGKPSELFKEANLLIPCENIAGSSFRKMRGAGRVEVEDTGLFSSVSSSLTLDKAAIGNANCHEQRENGCSTEVSKRSDGWMLFDKNATSLSGYNHITADDLFTSLSNKDPGHADGTTLITDVIDEVYEPRPASDCNSGEIDFSLGNGIHGTATVSAVHTVPRKVTPHCAASLSKRRECVRLRHQISVGATDSDSEKMKGMALYRSGNGVIAGCDQEQFAMPKGWPAVKAATDWKTKKETFDVCHRGENDTLCRSVEHVDISRAGQKCQDEQDNPCLEGNGRSTKDSSPKGEQIEPQNPPSMIKGTGESILREEGKNDVLNVLNLAKEAGLPDAVAAACNALDKLINAALQGIGGSVTTKSAVLPISSGRRRGKALTAEMYVALTEALIEVVQVLKDHVELLCWCFDCLGNILPPTTNDSLTCDGSLNTGCTGLGSFFSSKELLHAAGCKGTKAEGLGVFGKQSIPQQSNGQSSSQSSKQSSLATESEMSTKAVAKSFSGAVTSGTSKNACENVCPTFGKNSNGLGSSFCGSISSDSAASSISALAAVAYTATVPMLAEKAVKAVLSAMQPCDIEAHSTQAVSLTALRALSAHLSSTNSKYVCDDAIAFIVAAMREFKCDAEMQTESCLALSSLNRAISSATGHNAWSAITDTMDNHQANLIVQRAGCGALQVLCTRSGLGVPEWGSGKRPLRATKDTDREVGVRVLASAMLSFPEDVRIQWHGCSTLWTLVHSAGVRSVANMARNGAVSAVVGAMLVCRMNEMMQQEGCNVLGTMARILAENGYEFGPLLPSDLERSALATAGHNNSDRNSESDERVGKPNLCGASKGKERSSNSPDDWCEALNVVVSAMRAFSKSKSVQSNGTFALGCILKGSVETIHLGMVAPGISPMPTLPLSNTKPSKAESALSSCGNDTTTSRQIQKDFSPLLSADSCFERAGVKQPETLTCLGKDLIDDIERLNAAVEVTMAAMPEFSKVETVQVWGCAVLQQAFLAYVQYSKLMMPLSSCGSMVKSGTSQKESNCKSPVDIKNTTQASSAIPSPASALANLVLSQATSAMFMISGTMALSYSGNTANGCQQVLNKAAPSTLSKTLPKLTPSSSSGVKSQSSAMNQCFASVRQSWCAALGAIGNVFGHLTRNSEVSVGKSLPSTADSLDLTELNGCVDHSAVGPCVSNGKSAWLNDKMDGQLKEIESGCHEDENRFILGSMTPWKCPKYSHGLNESEAAADGKPSVSLLKEKLVKGSRDCKRDMHGHVDSSCENRILNSCLSSEAKEWGLTRKGWGGVDTLSQEQAIKDIKAWQEATESLALIADRVGFPMSVKNSILAIRTVLYKLDDAETVIWACHALISLYLTWENVHLFKPGVENDPEDYKAKTWGEGDVGVRQLVYLVSHWTGQNRPDVTSLALQALYSACVFAATVREIEDVFAPAGCGTEAVLGAMQQSLGSSGSLSQRRKVIQQSCCVLTAICGCSIPAQIAFAAAGGADIILAALERYNEDSQISVNGLHALGLDSRSQPDFDALWNAAIYRNSASSGGKGSRKKKGGSSLGGSVVVGLSHIFKEGAGLVGDTNISSVGEKWLADGLPEHEAFGKSRWTPQLERLVFDGTAQMGLFRTWLIAGPGCGGAPFAIAILRRLSLESQNQSSMAEMQAHVCLVIGFMSAHDSKWRQEFLDAGALEVVLDCMESIYSWSVEKFPIFYVVSNGAERIQLPDESKREAISFYLQGMPERGASQDFKQDDRRSDFGLRNSLDAPLQSAACWALSGLVKDHKGSFPICVNLIIQALATTLHRYGGLLHLNLHVARAEKVHSEVCAPARLALARLGVSRFGENNAKHLAHEAAEADDLSSLEALAKKGVDLLAIDCEGHSPLWYAEQSGQTKAVHYLKEQAQLYGRRRAREKAKAKNRHGTSKVESLTLNVENVKTELQVLQEVNLSQDLLKAAEFAKLNALDSAHLEETSMSEADCYHPVPLGQESEISKELQDCVALEYAQQPDIAARRVASFLSTENFQTKATTEMASKKNGISGKKGSKGGRRAQSKQQKMKLDSPTSSLSEVSATSCLAEEQNLNVAVCGGQEDETIGINRENLPKVDDIAFTTEKSEYVGRVMCKSWVSCGAENWELAKEACAKSPNANVTSCAIQEDDNAATDRQNLYELDSSVLKTRKAEHLSMPLYEAVDVVEKLDASARACEKPSDAYVLCARGEDDSHLMRSHIVIDKADDSALRTKKSELVKGFVHEALTTRIQNMEASVSAFEESSDLNVSVFSKKESDTDETSRQSSHYEVDVSILHTKKSEHINRILCEALVSGVVENLEAAVRECEEPDCGADAVLLKKVKAALVKRLKRLEKSSALQTELSAAVEEGKSSRLHAAIVAVEKVPRFVAAFSEEVTAARHLLFEIERKERMMESGEAHVASEGSSVDEVPVVQIEDDGNGDDETDELRSNMPGELKTMDAEGSNEAPMGRSEGFSPLPKTRVGVVGWNRGGNCRRDAVTLNLNGSQSETLVPQSRSRRERGSRGRTKGNSACKNPLYPSHGPGPHLGHGSVRILRSKASCPLTSSQPVEMISSGSREMPPLLPTPKSSEVVPLTTGQISRSVIQPPRHKDQTISPSLEHNPITPQLFPFLQGPPLLGYSCHGEFEEREEIDLSASSISSKNHFVQPDSESGLHHISQLFPPPWASPQLFPYRESVQHNPFPPDSLSESGTSSPGSLASLLATILPSHLTGAPVSCSSTLFSTPLERSPFPLSFCGPVCSNNAAETFLPASVPALNAHARPFLPTSEPLVSTLPPFVQQALSCTCDEEGCQEQLESLSSPMLTASPVLSRDIHESYNNMHPNLGMCLMKKTLTEEGCDPRTGLNCVGHHDLQHVSEIRLQQAALLDASMEDSCCICFDSPKDAALISCGHRMCKGCAEEMHRIRHLCPVCNRIIEAVLALYG